MRFSTFSTNIGRDCRHINDILLIKGCVHQTLSNDDDVLWVLYKTFTYPIGVVMIEVWSCPLFSREIQPTVFHYKYVLDSKFQRYTCTRKQSDNLSELRL